MFSSLHGMLSPVVPPTGNHFLALTKDAMVQAGEPLTLVKPEKGFRKMTTVQ